jgi:MoxR-like ATPase
LAVEREARLSLPDLAVQRVRLAAAARAAFLNHLWSLEESGQTARSAERLAEQADHPAAEAAFRAADPEAQDLASRLAATEAAIAAAEDPRYRALTRVFGLNPGEEALLQLALAAEADPGIAPLLRHVSPLERADYPTDALASRLFAGRGFGLWREDGAAARWRLLLRLPMGAGLPDRIALDPAIRDFLAGGGLIAGELMGAALPLAAPQPPASWPVEATAAEIGRILEERSPGGLAVAVRGPRGVGRKSFAAAVAQRLGLQLVAIDLDRIAPAALEQAMIAAHRLAFLTGSALAFEGRLARDAHLPLDLSPFPLVFLALDPAAAGDPAEEAAGPPLAVTLEPPSADERAALWRRLCPSAAAWPAGELDRLAARHRSTPGAIASVAATAPTGAEQAAAALRALDHERFGALAQRLECPFSFEDLVLPGRLEAHLQALLHEARVRGRFFERPAARRLFPQGRGLIALFTGPPGTGKTMAAQVIAAALGLDLYRVEVSTLVSKYIGETMENLQRVLNAARQIDVVLLFDEADGFFARRTELSTSNDRHANQDTGHLLQAIDSFPGIALLASNRKRNIDEAFTRRLRHVIDFPLPDDAARARIWRRILGELGGLERLSSLEGPIAAVSRRVELTGAQIKQAMLTAIFAADAEGSELSLPHILAGIDAELMKDGRALTARERAELEAGR